MIQIHKNMSNVKFHGIHITKGLSWNNNTTTVVKRAQQLLYFLHWLKKCVLPHRVLSKYHCCTIESIQTSCITAWYENCYIHNCNALQ